MKPETIPSLSGSPYMPVSMGRRSVGCRSAADTVHAVCLLSYCTGKRPWYALTAVTVHTGAHLRMACPKACTTFLGFSMNCSLSRSWLKLPYSQESAAQVHERHALRLTCAVLAAWPHGQYRNGLHSGRVTPQQYQILHQHEHQLPPSRAAPGNPRGLSHQKWRRHHHSSGAG